MERYFDFVAAGINLTPVITHPSARALGRGGADGDARTADWTGQSTARARTTRNGRTLMPAALARGMALGLIATVLAACGTTAHVSGAAPGPCTTSARYGTCSYLPYQVNQNMWNMTARSAQTLTAQSAARWRVSTFEPGRVIGAGLPKRVRKPRPADQRLHQGRGDIRGHHADRGESGSGVRHLGQRRSRHLQHRAHDRGHGLDQHPQDDAVRRPGHDRDDRRPGLHRLGVPGQGVCQPPLLRLRADWERIRRAG